jgi:hypothetical protein
MRIPSPHHGVRWGAGPGVKRYSGEPSLDARSARAPSLKRLLILAWFRQDGCRGPSAAPGYARRPRPSLRATSGLKPRTRSIRDDPAAIGFDQLAAQEPLGPVVAAFDQGLRARAAKSERRILIQHYHEVDGASRVTGVHVCRFPAPLRHLNAHCRAANDQPVAGSALLAGQTHPDGSSLSRFE